MWKAVAVTASYIPIDGSFESVQSLKVFERRYRDMFVRCHENYLVNPECKPYKPLQNRTYIWQGDPYF